MDLHGERFELRVMQIDDDGAVRLVSEGPLKPRTEYIRRDGQVLELGHARARILAPTREGRRVAVLEVVAGPPATLEKLYRGSKL